MMIEEYVGIIMAALDNVAESYFSIRTTYNTNGIIRERAFCYELYHQIRCLQDKCNKHDITINGEVDKSGHIKFALKHQKNPDFVFHIPGQMEGNTMVIEVKGKLNRIGILKDFETLSIFVEKYDYQKGLFILYNHSKLQFLKELKPVITEQYSGIHSKKNDKVVILCKESHRHPTEIFTLAEILSNNGENLEVLQT